MSYTYKTCYGISFFITFIFLIFYMELTEKKLYDNYLSLLLKKIKNTDYLGYDPIDFKASEFYKNKIAPIRIIKISVDIIDFFFPKTLRKFAKTKPDILFASVLGYLLETNCLLYKVTKKESYKNEALSLADKLIALSIKEYEGMCWGLPFGWVSGKNYIKINTPNAVNTSEIANGFLELYSITKDIKHLEVLKGISHFMTKELKVTYQDEDSMCMSYTPIDNYQVHNANLLAADTLVKIGVILKDNNLITQAKKMCYFACNDQLENGSLPYHSTHYTNNGSHSNDIYHAGYEIRCLYSVYSVTKDEKIKKGLDKYLNYFNTHYYNNKYPTTLIHANVEFINFHGCAEAVYCNSVLSNYSKEYLSKAKEDLHWTLENMITDKLKITNEIRKYKFLSYRSNINFVRWGEAVFCRAIARYLYEVFKNKGEQHVIKIINMKY